MAVLIKGIIHHKKEYYKVQENIESKPEEYYSFSAMSPMGCGFAKNQEDYLDSKASYIQDRGVILQY